MKLEEDQRLTGGEVLKWSAMWTRSMGKLLAFVGGGAGPFWEPCDAFSSWLGGHEGG